MARKALLCLAAVLFLLDLPISRVSAQNYPAADPNTLGQWQIKLMPGKAPTGSFVPAHTMLPRPNSSDIVFIAYNIGGFDLFTPVKVGNMQMSNRPSLLQHLSKCITFYIFLLLHYILGMQSV